MGRVLRVLGLFVAGVVALVATAYVVHGVTGMREVAAAKEQAAADLDEAVATARPETVAAHQEAAARLGPPTYEWQEVVCDLTTHDAGWIVNDYAQECSLRVVSLVEVHDASTECQQLAAPQGTGRSTTVTAWRAPAPTLESADYVSGCPSGLLKPGMLSASRLLAGTRPSSLSASPSWIVVEARTSLTDSVLGCDPWGVLFCSSPVDEPVLG